MKQHNRTLLTVVAEAALEKLLVRDIGHFGAHVWTVGEVHGAVAEGVREGSWEADRTIEMKVVCEAAVAERIADHVMQTYAANYGVAMYFSDVRVLRPAHF